MPPIFRMGYMYIDLVSPDALENNIKITAILVYINKRRTAAGNVKRVGLHHVGAECFGGVDDAHLQLTEQHLPL